MSSRSPGSGNIGRWVKWLIALGILGGGGYYLWAQFFSAAPVAITYRTSPVTRGKLTQVVTAAGQISALVMVQVGSQISGTIEKLNVDFNDPVKEGQIIAELDAATYRAVVAQGEGDLANARAALELARLNAERKKQLMEQKVEVKVMNNDSAQTTVTMNVKDDGFKSLIDAVKKDGLAADGKVSIELKDGKLTINGKEQSVETFKKYEALFNGQKNISISVDTK